MIVIESEKKIENVVIEDLNNKCQDMVASTVGYLGFDFRSFQSKALKLIYVFCKSGSVLVQ